MALHYCRVVGRLLATHPDSASDPDDLPDLEPMRGTATITMNVKGELKHLDPAGPVTLFPQELTMSLDSEGHLAWNGERYAMLLAPSPDLSPDDFNYSVTFQVAADEVQQTKPYGPFPFNVVPDGEVDLTLTTPVGVVSGVPVTVGQRGSRWYVSTPETTDYVNVPDPVAGDIFLYPVSRDLFQYDGAEWAYAGALGV